MGHFRSWAFKQREGQREGQKQEENLGEGKEKHIKKRGKEIGMEGKESMKDRNGLRERSGNRAWGRMSQKEEEDRNTDSVRESKMDIKGKSLQNIL